jgi:hypothetical protein
MVGRSEALGRWAGLLLAAALAFQAGPPVHADETSPLSPLLDIQVLPHKLLALDAESGGGPSVRLEIGERVLSVRQQGRVGLAITDRRLLAVATGSGSWQEARWRRGESPPLDPALGDRVALVLTPLRLLGFDGGSHNLIEAPLGPQENVVASDVGANVVVVVTNRRALGLSSFRGGWFEANLRVGEQVQSLTALANLATLRTSKRLLVFRGPTASWEEQQLLIR